MRIGQARMIARMTVVTKGIAHVGAIQGLIVLEGVMRVDVDHLVHNPLHTTLAIAHSQMINNRMRHHRMLMTRKPELLIFKMQHLSDHLIQDHGITENLESRDGLDAASIDGPSEVHTKQRPQMS